MDTKTPHSLLKQRTQDFEFWTRDGLRSNANMTPAGLEPAIPGSVGRCLIHWATGPAEMSGTGLALHRGSDLSTTRGAPHPRGTDAYVPTPAGGPGRAPVARRLQRAFGD